MENQKQFELFMKEIVNIQTKLRDRGITKEGKGNYGKIFSLAQLTTFFRKYSETLTPIFVPAGIQEVIVAEGKINVHAVGQYVFYYKKPESKTQETKTAGEEFTIGFPVPAVGTDRNDSSFAFGKAITYGRRYFLSGLLDLTSEDLEPENPEVLKKELRIAINTKLSLDEEKASKFRAAYKAKYKTNFDVNKLTVATMQKIEAQL